MTFIDAGRVVPPVMSYDDGPRRRIDENTGRASDEETRTGPLDTVVERLRRHVREWPSRYVDQQAELYET
jgi:hypothetical protein